jgi:hypothetical protein
MSIRERQVAAGAEAIRREIRSAAQLHNPLGNLVGVQLLISGMLQKLLGHTLGIDTRGHEVVGSPGE